MDLITKVFLAVPIAIIGTIIFTAARSAARINAMPSPEDVSSTPLPPRATFGKRQHKPLVLPPLEPIEARMLAPVVVRHMEPAAMEGKVVSLKSWRSANRRR